MRSIIALIFLLTLSGCHRWPKGGPPYRHTVRYQGETPAMIASWYTGKQSNWPLMKKAGTRQTVKTLKVGETVLIPRQVLRRANRLPYQYVRDFQRGRHLAYKSKPVRKRTQAAVAKTHEAESHDFWNRLSGGEELAGETPRNSTEVPVERSSVSLRPPAVEPEAPVAANQERPNPRVETAPEPKPEPKAEPIAAPKPEPIAEPRVVAQEAKSPAKNTHARKQARSQPEGAARPKNDLFLGLIAEK